MDDSTGASETPNHAPPPVAMTPMLTQYLGIKARYPDCILFYRMGDFYEMFFQDAVVAAPVLEVQLTSRDRNAENPIPMCGIPYHAVQSYLQKMIGAGHKVAICEQVEDPAQAKGIVRRDVTRVVTPAMVGDPDLLSEEDRPLLAAIERTSEGWEVGTLDLSDSEFRVGRLEGLSDFLAWVCEARPKECLVRNQETADTVSSARVPNQTYTLRPEYFSDGVSDGRSVVTRAIERYFFETQQRDGSDFFRTALPLKEERCLALDAATVRALDLVPISRDQKNGTSLFEFLDSCCTSMGRRLLKYTVLHPSSDLKAIEHRLESVQNLFEDPALLHELQQHLGTIRDLERLASKTALGLALPRDLVAIQAVLATLPQIKARLERCQANRLKDIREALDPLEDLRDTLFRALEDPAPHGYKEGGVFKAGFDPRISEWRSLLTEAKEHIAKMELRERERTGIPSLKIKFSKVFGYTIEVTKTHLSKVPDDYHRKQTISTGERFVTEELKDFEDKVNTADIKLRRLEEQLYLELRDTVAQHNTSLLRNARLLAELDLIASFAVTSRRHGYSRPRFHESRETLIQAGRHPTVENALPPGTFVPNSVHFSEETGWTWILTGPNMGGKSTIMRQIALISLMGQSGCFVPAQSATLSVLDAIFTRIGSADDLVHGRSTFMVEMSEMSRILGSATENSLVLVDEVGRGTSTYDGLSLAWALLEYLHQTVRAKTLFATHFHEITALGGRMPGLVNYHVRVQHSADSITFLYLLAPGVSHRSYGIDVARLAGLPPDVLDRAKEIQGRLESFSQRSEKTRSKAMDAIQNQLEFFRPS